MVTDQYDATEGELLQIEESDAVTCDSLVIEHCPMCGDETEFFPDGSFVCPDCDWATDLLDLLASENGPNPFGHDESWLNG